MANFKQLHRDQLLHEDQQLRVAAPTRREAETQGCLPGRMQEAPLGQASLHEEEEKEEELVAAVAAAAAGSAF